MEIINRLQALRKEMEKRNIDVYLIPTSDFHETEYVGEHFKARAWMSNFSGSAGTLVVCRKCAALWTDGRYFIQAAKELQGTTINLMKMGEEGTVAIEDYVAEHLSQNGVLGFDGRVVNTKLAETLKDKIKQKQGSMHFNEDLVGLIWKDRPSLPKEDAFYLDERFSGKSIASKLTKIRKEMKQLHADVHILSSLDDIAWYLNMRGNDIACYPVVLSFFIIEENTAKLFVDESKLNEQLKKKFAESHIELYAYEAIYHAVENVSEHARVLLDKHTVNYKITSSLPRNVQIIDQKNPSQLWKSIKNETELENNRKAHIKDGVAVTKFMYWLKQNIKNQTITEAQAADVLEDFRKQQENFIEISFDTISAYQENAAMMHYHCDHESTKELNPQGFLLVDSGGQYYEGTTDITRTFVLGDISDQMRHHFTSVLRGMINLSRAKFLYGCSGMNLDILAREPLWCEDIDYKCGTGHGVGFVLNVHEGPNGFRWKVVPERNDNVVLQAGMVTTVEPGIYLEGQYGIRTENELITRKGVKNEYGQFMEFETITFAPIDLDGINPKEMSRDEKNWLNAYHKEVYDKISPYLSDEECVWLKEYTRPID
ncbi:MAG: aminopeptidase P family protein [Erysipelotrichaceae bacterium]|nr:aminopeptidase P family protein [Erysipelotrichaceae bacterium]